MLLLLLLLLLVLQVPVQRLPDRDMPAVSRHHHLAGPLDLGAVEA